MLHQSWTSSIEAGPDTLLDLGDLRGLAARGSGEGTAGQPGGQPQLRSLPPRRCRAAWTLDEEGGIAINQSLSR